MSTAQAASGMERGRPRPRRGQRDGGAAVTPYPAHANCGEFTAVIRKFRTTDARTGEDFIPTMVPGRLTRGRVAPPRLRSEGPSSPRLRSSAKFEGLPDANPVEFDGFSRRAKKARGKRGRSP